MPESKRNENDGKVLAPPGGERKAARAAARKAELSRIAPVLVTIPWRNIRAGYARVRDIADFIRFYEMYAPLLAEGEELLVKARDSGHYEYFDLRATAGGVTVAGIDRHGNAKVLLEIRKDYWEGEYPPGPGLLTPL